MMKRNFTEDWINVTMDIAARSLSIKRTIITKLLNGRIVSIYEKKYLGTFDNNFSTIGLIRMNEAGLEYRSQLRQI